ncbi:Phytanoyl-CoA dioxygenase peroxisomal [Penicillium angulare]|uniref:Phytanoyl-CoA dioxygenase peroxisomal n=1 Tax=Penicillium angulare TaxID=116970 RepID=A0A9W9G7S7_9EURO|nr:Phytanoyl-CoA dioxygenase peroxisomal [Penicillium angulare]
MKNSDSTTGVHNQTDSWSFNLTSAGSATRPRTTDENACFTRERYEPVQLSVSEYHDLREKGFVKVAGLIPQSDIQDLSSHMDRVLEGEETATGFPKIDSSMPESERIARFSRIHNAHRVHAKHERFLLHPRILDVLEKLNGPDVLALQSMTFFKQPGQPGQGYHQDSYYIPTLPNTLIAARVAISEATEENGCLWFRVGSQVEPLYPQSDNEFTHESRALKGVFDNYTASEDDTNINQLAAIADRYPEVACPAKPGDVIFFHGNILHRSHANISDTPRRAFAGHYCDARSFVPWNTGDAWEGMEQGKGANRYHVLARGDTNLEFAFPIFGTPSAAIETRKPRLVGCLIDMPLAGNGEMGMGSIKVMR